MSDTRLYIGIDNGATGTIGMISTCGYGMYETPVEKCSLHGRKKNGRSQSTLGRHGYEA